MHVLERRPRETGRDYALRNIKENIIHLDLAPGSLVSENELSAEIGLSRTPVREALIELSRVKIVEIKPQKRSMIAPINYDLVEESRFMRYVLECSVVELACSMATEADIRSLSENVKLQNFYLEDSNCHDALLELDNQFHALLFGIAQKPQVYTLIENISIHFDRVRRMALDSVKDLRIVQDHAAIVVAIRENKPQEARRLVQLHLDRYKVDADEIRARFPNYF